MLGAIFADALQPYSHWGWSDLSCLYGDMSTVIGRLGDYDVVTYPDAVCCVKCCHYVLVS